MIQDTIALAGADTEDADYHLTDRSLVERINWSAGTWPHARATYICGWEKFKQATCGRSTRPTWLDQMQLLENVDEERGAADGDKGKSVGADHRVGHQFES